ncbi:MAG: glucose-1-phosphate adenylyltransferase [Acholeplasmataceae bacterium]|jgi:glucose-1-phosphate adenylyltransferase|nr:glucose-1-phosphate adenylyltransferase [Acholeplasmataceae bacterium]
METLAIILAGGKGSRLDLLSDRRSKPAMPFAGKFRIIDFTLSNCSNSGIYDIAILTQYLPLSLNEHIGAGKPWDLDRRDSSITLLQPHAQWYEGTADAVLKNIRFIKRRNPKYILILSGDHIYKMNYRMMIKEHEEKNADLTIASTHVPLADANRFGILTTDNNNQVIEFEEKPRNPKSNRASMGIYIFNAGALYDALENAQAHESDFGQHIIPKLIAEQKRTVFAYDFEGYWKDVGTIDSYLETSLELLDKEKGTLDLYDTKWKIHTRSEELPPVKIGDNATIKNSLISNGSIIEGTVINSILSPGVYVGKNSVVKDSVIFNFTYIGENVTIDKSIIDKKVVVGNNTKIGFGKTYTRNIEKPDLLFSGINVIAKHAVIPSDTIIERNCRIFDTAYFNSKQIKSGSTL